jgi:murein DD-endopeptidase MepM/ murein hydrolase activator NlpD
MAQNKKNQISKSMFLLTLLLAACARKDEPCDVLQIRALTTCHTVRAGEDVASVAQKYGMSIQELCRINNGLRESSLLVAGQRLTIIPQHTVISQSHSGADATPEIVVYQNSKSFEEAAADSVGGAANDGGGEGSGGVPATSADDSWDRVDSDDGKTGNAGAAGGHGKTADDEYESAKRAGAKEEFLDYEDTGSLCIWPVKGRILRRFKETLPNGTPSEGINIAAPIGVNVRACMGGTVLEAGELVLGFGKMVILSHENNMVSIYGHLQEITVRRPHHGEVVKVKMGQVIGKVGKTGNVRIPQLHFQLRNAKKDPVDPLKFLQD